MPGGTTGMLFLVIYHTDECKGGGGGGGTEYEHKS